MYCDFTQWRLVRRRILEEGKSKKSVSRETGIDRRLINKMLKHEYPPGYHARPRHYPNLGPFIPTIDKLLHDDDTPMPARPRPTARHIFERLCCEEGFIGSYDSVRKYIRGRVCRDESAWERAYELVLRLPKHRAINLMRFLSRGNTSVLASTHFRALTRELASKSQRAKREEQRRADIEWMRRVLQKQINDDVLLRDFNDIQDLPIMLRYLRTGPLLHRNRAMVVLACHRKIPGQTIGAFLGVSKGFVRKYRNKFASGGADNVFAPQTKSNRKVDNADLQRAVFGLLHEPPTTYGINRTTWTMSILCQVLRKNGRQVGHKVVGKIIKAAGYKWRKAKVVLTSNDPAYKEKLDRIRSILANLQPDEAFFSIDEYGPFAIKTKPGRMLAAPGFQPTVPQWQKSRGCIIMTAALELAGNQVTHFYSGKKNTAEMIRMMQVLIHDYADRRKLYLSWDAASWHISKQLYLRIDAHNLKVTKEDDAPLIETAPLPAGAQFLNVIESVFSGMARAIIHSSDYQSVEDARAAIDRYFAERNKHFRRHPRRAGKKIWGKEREPAVFSESNNCKDPKYR